MRRIMETRPGQVLNPIYGPLGTFQDPDCVDDSRVYMKDLCPFRVSTKTSL